MKEYDETEAIELMAQAVPENVRDNDSICEVLDLIYDYYDENGDLEIDFDDDDTQDDVADIVEFIQKAFAKNPAAVEFSTQDIAAMVNAEIKYENSLI